MPSTQLNKIKEQLESAFQPVRDLIDRQKSASLMIAAGVILLLDVVLILMPLVRTAYQQSTRLSVLTKDINEVHRDKSAEGGLKASLQKEKQKLEESESVLALGDVALYLETFSAIAQETGVKLSAVHPALPVPQGDDKQQKPATKSDGTYEATYFSISARAGYHELGRFVERMENSPTFTKVVHLSISPIEDMPDEHEAQIMIKMIRKPAAG